MREQKDISIYWALLFLIIVVLAVGFMENTDFLINFWEKLRPTLYRNRYFIIAVMLSAFSNVLLIIAILERTFGYKKQGSRLRSIKGEKNKNIFIKSLLLAIVVYLPIHFLILNEYGSWMRPEIKTVAGFSFYITTSFIVISFLKLFLFVKTKLIHKKTLPKYHEKQNSLILGSVGEEDSFDDEKRPRWIQLKQKALNGNILITGSIGSGKTQGTILVYVDQILKNFKPRPSMLILDPKGTFIPEVRKMAKTYDLKECIDLSLGGKHTFNPVYIKNALKKSRFAEIASMIRAAAKNFSSKSNESPIWENSAFNLTKNVVIFCSATKEYFTLNDIYEVMLEASEKTIIKELSDCLLLSKYSEEEKYNIHCAIRYFKEFQQFEDKFRSSVLVTSTTFLNQFQDFQISQIFCPSEKNLTIENMDKIIDDQIILLVDIENESLSKPIGTFVKLHYERSVLNRLKDSVRKKDHMAIIVADEYQDIASVSHGAQIGDEKILAKGREANFFFLAASQSIVSIFNAIQNEKASKELIQNFRTRIACHSSDIDTIRNFKELLGQKENNKITKSISENLQKARKNYLLGGFDSLNANISESFSTSKQKEYLVTGKEFSQLKTFESFSQVYDGVRTRFFKLFLKPHFLEKKNTPQKRIVEMLDGIPPSKTWHLIKKAVCIGFLLISTKVLCLPNICSVVNKPEFHSCLQFTVTPTMCGWPIPRPCVRFSYFVPQTFIEVSARAGGSYFIALPGAAIQLAGVQTLPPFGTEGDNDTQSYHAHTVSVPFASIPFNMMPCGGTRIPKLCFDGMSEHIYQHWSTGMSDKFQPKFLAWSLAPKACLIKGAVTSVIGGEPNFSFDSPMCSIPLPPIPTFLPSRHSACNGWGVFYPRMGSYNGPASLTGALMIASRMKSLSSEVFRSTPGHPIEKWQMISPGSSSCFREGQNMGILETIKNAREIGRLYTGRLSGHLFVIWKHVSCTRDLPYVPVAKGAIVAMKSICLGLGGL